MRYLIAMVLVVLFAVLGIVFIFGGGNGGPAGDNTVKLVEYADDSDARVSFTTQGRLTGDDQYRAIRITVTHDQRVLEVLSGYDERVENRVEFSNSDAGFETFLNALDGLNFGRQRDVERPDSREACPLGYRYIYRLAKGTEEVMRTWSTSCRVEGTFAGNAREIRALFERQITDYDKLVRTVRL